MVKKKRFKKQLIWAAVLLLLAGLGTFLWKSGFFSALTSVESVQAYVERFAPFSHLIYFLAQLASVILAPVPSNLLAAAGGVLFGTVPAFLLTFAAVTVGSMLVFALAKLLGGSFAEKLVSKKVSEKYLELIHIKRDVFLALAFLFPFFPDDLICILAGLTGISPLRFFLLVLLTRPWGLLFACALGGSSFSLTPKLLIPLVACGVALFLLGLKYGDRIEQALLKKFKKD